MRKYWIVTVGLVALLAACSSPTPAAPGTAPALDGTSWTVTHVKGKPTIPASPPTMTFAADRVSGTTGCNSYGAGYTATSSGLGLSQAALTAMACTDAAVMAQEQAFSTALGTITGVRTAGAGLELLDVGQQVVLTLAKVDSKPLEGTSWQLSGVISKDAIISPVAGSTVTMSITGDQLSGKACNTFRGQVTVDGDNFKAGPLMSTKMACANPDENAQETTVLTTLEAATGYTIAGSTLTLKAGDGTGLEFRAA